MMISNIVHLLCLICVIGLIYLIYPIVSQNNNTIKFDLSYFITDKKTNTYPPLLYSWDYYYKNMNKNNISSNLNKIQNYKLLLDFLARIVVWYVDDIKDLQKIQLPHLTHLTN